MVLMLGYRGTPNIASVVKCKGHTTHHLRGCNMITFYAIYVPLLMLTVILILV